MYTEHHWEDVKDVGVAFEETPAGYQRVWICINGRSILRAKLMPDKTLAVEFTPPYEAPPDE